VLGDKGEGKENIMQGLALSGKSKEEMNKTKKNVDCNETPKD